MQETISTDALRPYAKRVRERIAKNADNPTWAALEARWTELAGNCGAYVASLREQGLPSMRHERTAYMEIRKIADHVGATEVVETALAMHLMQSAEPQRFVSDKAFRRQLTRRLRGLTEVNAGTWYDHATGRTKRVYRELTPRAADVFGRLACQVFGGVGVWLARMEEQEADEEQAARAALSDAVGRLV